MFNSYLSMKKVAEESLTLEDCRFFLSKSGEKQSTILFDNYIKKYYPKNSAFSKYFDYKALKIPKDVLNEKKMAAIQLQTLHLKNKMKQTKRKAESNNCSVRRIKSLDPVLIVNQTRVKNQIGKENIKIIPKKSLKIRNQRSRRTSVEKRTISQKCAQIISSTEETGIIAKGCLFPALVRQNRR